MKDFGYKKRDIDLIGRTFWKTRNADDSGATLDHQGGCGACTVLLHAPGEKWPLARPCMANACLRPLHSLFGSNHCNTWDDQLVFDLRIFQKRHEKFVAIEADVTVAKSLQRS